MDSQPPQGPISDSGDLNNCSMWKPWPWHRRHSRDHAGDAEPRRRRSHRSSSSRSSTASAMDPWLLSLPEEATESVLQFLDHKSLHALELSGRSGLEAIQSVEFWHRSLSHSLVCYDDPLASPAQRAALWKRMHCLRSHRKSSSSSSSSLGFASDTLLTGVVANDSPNDFSVPPTWLLFKSRCWFWMEKLLSKTAADLAVDDASMYVRQLHCGCGYHVPCFWSSGSSTSQDASSFLEFNVRAQTFVAGVQLVPYQAYWLDENPAFAPKQVSFSFFHRDSSVADAFPVSFYTSPVFPVKNTMTLQHFELPKTVYAASDCVLRVNLIGRTQRAPLEERPWIANNSLVTKTSNASEDSTNAPFYCCLSYVNASGIVIPEETLKKPKKWWLPTAHQ